MEKICKKCNTLLKLTEYYLQKQKSKDGLTTWDYYDCYCKKCRTKYQVDRRITIKRQAIDYLGGKCTDCGLIDEPYIFDFYHLDPNEKEFTIAKTGGVSLEKLKPELDKCVVLCANCHRRRHNKEV